MHARLAFSLASAYAGEPVGPRPAARSCSRRPPSPPRRSPSSAAESLVDGCLLEGVAAEVARRALAPRARSAGARAVLAVIARDEASHAALAWDVVQWCCDRGGDPVRRALTAALRRGARLGPRRPRIPAALADALADHGWLGAAVWEDAFHATEAAVIARVAVALAAG